MANSLVRGLLIVAILLTSTTCIRPPRASRASSQPSEEGATPTVKITSPRAGESLRAGDLTVTFAVRGITVVAPAAGRGADDRHVDVFLDGDVGRYVTGDAAIPVGTDRIVHTGEGSVSFRDVTPGSHVITIVLATGAHLAAKPRVWDSVSVLVQ